MPVGINVFSHVQALIREFGLFGGLRLQLDETIAPVAIVADVTPNPRIECAVAFRMPPLAGNWNYQQLYNRPDSGLVAELKHVALSTSVNQGFQVYLEDPTIDVNPTASSFIVDRRRTPDAVIGRRPQCVLYTFSDVAVFSGDLVFRGGAASTTSLIVDLEGYTLMPGTGLVVSSELVNTEVEAAFRWAERPLLPGE